MIFLSVSRWAGWWLVLLALTARAQSDIPPPPNPPRLVNDLAGILTAEQRTALERRLVAYDDSTSTQISVVTVPSLGDYDVADYAVRLGEKWGIGRRQKDNGVLLLVAPNERRVNISTGYGLEGAIPDAVARRVIDQHLTPHFRTGDYYGGIVSGTNALMQLAAGEYEGEAAEADAPNVLPLLVVMAVFIFIVVAIARSGKGGDNIRGRRGGMGLPAWWLLTQSGRGGGFGGGGFGGGGFGGGGFGGFGGGGFGGGGASGSW